MTNSMCMLSRLGASAVTPLPQSTWPCEQCNVHSPTSTARCSHCVSGTSGFLVIPPYWIAHISCGLSSSMLVKRVTVHVVTPHGVRY